MKLSSSHVDVEKLIFRLSHWSFSLNYSLRHLFIFVVSQEEGNKNRLHIVSRAPVCYGRRRMRRVSQMTWRMCRVMSCRNFVLKALRLETLFRTKWSCGRKKSRKHEPTRRLSRTAPNVQPTKNCKLNEHWYERAGEAQNFIIKQKIKFYSICI